MELNEWLDQMTGGDDAQAIAEHAGISKRTVQHQIKTGRMSLENIVKIADAYGHHPLTILIERGYVDAEWAGKPDIPAALRLATEDQLADEVLRRMKLGVDTVGDMTVDELAARRAHAFNPELDVATEDDQDAARYGDDDDLHIP